MEKVMPLYEYEPLVLFLEPEISNEKKEKGGIERARPSNTKVVEEPKNLIGGRIALRRRLLNRL
jgi:hypothetical protein